MGMTNSPLESCVGLDSRPWAGILGEGAHVAATLPPTLKDETVIVYGSQIHIPPSRRGRVWSVWSIRSCLVPLDMHYPPPAGRFVCHSRVNSFGSLGARIPAPPWIVLSGKNPSRHSLSKTYYYKIKLIVHNFNEIHILFLFLV